MYSKVGVILHQKNVSKPSDYGLVTSIFSNARVDMKVFGRKQGRVHNGFQNQIIINHYKSSQCTSMHYPFKAQRLWQEN